MKKFFTVLLMGVLLLALSGVSGAEEWKRVDLPEWVGVSLEVPGSYTREADQKTPTMLVHYFLKKESYKQKVILVEKHPVMDSLPKEDVERNAYLLWDYPMDSDEHFDQVMAQVRLNEKKAAGSVVNMNGGHRAVAYELEGRDIVGVEMIFLKKGYIVRVLVAADRQLIPSEKEEFTRILESVEI